MLCVLYNKLYITYCTLEYMYDSILFITEYSIYMCTVIAVPNDCCPLGSQNGLHSFGLFVSVLQEQWTIPNDKRGLRAECYAHSPVSREDRLESRALAICRWTGSTRASWVQQSPRSVPSPQTDVDRSPTNGREMDTLMNKLNCLVI